MIFGQNSLEHSENPDAGRAEELFEAHRAPEAPEEILEKLKEAMGQEKDPFLQINLIIALLEQYQQDQEYQGVIGLLAIAKDPGRAEQIFTQESVEQEHSEGSTPESMMRAQELFVNLSKSQEELDAIELSPNMQSQGEDRRHVLELYEQERIRPEEYRNFIIRLGQLLILSIIAAQRNKEGKEGTSQEKDMIWEYIKSWRIQPPGKEHWLRQQAGEELFGPDVVKLPLQAVLAHLLLGSIKLGDWMQKYGKRQVRAMHLPHHLL